MPSTPVEEIKNRLNILDVIQGYIKVQKAGANYRAICPFHSEKSPSFFISPAKQIWHCFGSCGEGGDIFKFVMKIEGVEFGDALRILAAKAGVELKKEDPKIRTERERIYEANETACRFFEKQLDASLVGKEVKEYLLKRGITNESIKKWRLGYSPDSWNSLSDFLVSHGFPRDEIEKAGLAQKSQKTGNSFDKFRGRIMFPIFDISSSVVGFGGRVFKNEKRPDGEKEAKYINTPATLLYDKSRILYGLNQAGLSIRKNDFFIVVEGYTDAILAHQAGFENTVAASGTAFTQYQLGILKRYSENFYACFDMDGAGESATKRGIDLAQALGFNIKVVIMKEGLDPADIILEDPKIFQNSVSNAKTIHDFYFSSALSRFDKNTAEGRKEISRILLPIIKKIPNKIEQDIWIKSLSGEINVRETNIIEELRKTKDNSFEVPRAEQNKAKPKEEKKDRKKVLEENLLILSLKSPKNLDSIKEDEMAIFSPIASQAIACFKNKDFGMDGADDTIKNWANVLIAKSELIVQKPDEINIEFLNCLKELKKIHIKSNLDRISSDIKRAESENNNAVVASLSNEFSKISKLLYDIEN